MTTIQIANKSIGEAAPCYITFEAGPTHNGLESAKRLIKYSAEAGADAVKFQIFDPERLVSDKEQLFSYSILKSRGSVDLELVEEPLYDVLKRRCLKHEEWRKLKKYCDELKIAFFSTVAFDEDVDFLVDLGCDSIKIASADVNHFPLLKRVARTGVCIQLDTGMASLGEIESAINVIRNEGNDNIIIHQCPSGYPARLESINLNIIRTLRQMFPCPVAFSDHTPGNEMDIAAVALGANLVEKTITEDRMTRSVEHVMSIEPHEMKHFVKTIRDIEVALGTGQRFLHPEEQSKRMAVRRSAFLRREAKSGQTLAACELEFRRPGFGIPPNGLESLDKVIINKDLPAGHMLSMSDLQWL